MQLHNLLTITIPFIIAAHAEVTVTTYAGKAGMSGFHDGPRETALFDFPRRIAVGPYGIIYITDSRNQLIRKILPSGMVRTVAGNRENGYVDKIGNKASFSYPIGLAVTKTGSIYVADSMNSMVRRVTSSGVVSTVAGRDKYARSIGEAQQTRFKVPHGVAFDSKGIMYVADTMNGVIRRIAPDGSISTYAGTDDQGFSNRPSSEFKFSFPIDLVFDADDNLYIAEAMAHRISKITPDGQISVLAGNGRWGNRDGAGHDAMFNQPCGLTIDRQGNLYVSDTSNHIVRMVTQDGFVSTIAGIGKAGREDGPGHLASFNCPDGIAYHENNLYVVDSFSSTIRKISLGEKKVSKRMLPPRPH